MVLEGAAIFRVRRGAHLELLLTPIFPTAHGEAEPELQPYGGEMLLLSFRGGWSCLPLRLAVCPQVWPMSQPFLALRGLMDMGLH